jgi:formylglycine-generating enzyme required for sulfatase activity
VLDLQGVDARKSELAALSEELRAQLLQSGKFRVADRANIEKALEEQALQQTGCTSQECAVQVGKMLGVRKLVTGRVTKVSDTLWQMAAQLVDVESAETLRAVTHNQRGAFDALLTEGVVVLTAKLIGGAAPQQAAAALPQQAAVQAPSAGATFRDPTTGMEFAAIPGGEYEQGCHANAGECSANEKPTRRVQVRPFWLGKTEVTQGQWKRVMTNNPSAFKKGDDYPVEQVSWDDAQAFIRRLNAQSGQSYRLPSEAEWEYACRGGGKPVTYGTASGSLDRSTANFGQNEDGTTPAGKYSPNALGLSDMTGNVWEWTQDVYDGNAYRSGSADNPVNEGSGAYRVFRGGGWNYEPRDLRCSRRFGNTPSLRNYDLGFRLARSQ